MDNEVGADSEAEGTARVPSGLLDEAQRKELERLALEYPIIEVLLEAYDLESARLTVAGMDMYSVDGGYDCCGMSCHNFDGGRLWARRSNIRQVIDVVMSAIHETDKTKEPWWVAVNRDVAEHPEFYRPDAPEGKANAWVGPTRQTPGEAASESAEWVDERIRRIIDENQMYLELYRRQSSQIARLMIVLGAENIMQDPDDYLLEHHRDKLGSELVEALEKAKRTAEEE